MFKHENNRFYLENEEEKTLAEITYTYAGENVIIVDHTFVDPSLRGQGIGAQLVERVVLFAEEENLKIIPLCPYAKKEFTEKEAYHKVWHK